MKHTIIDKTAGNRRIILTCDSDKWTIDNYVNGEWQMTVKQTLIVPLVSNARMKWRLNREQSDDWEELTPEDLVAQ